jgi:hypothetical protein
MKRLTLLTGLFAALLCSHLQAQTVHLQANIPFDFQIGKTAMPAGAYFLEHDSHGVLRMTPVNRNGGAVMALTYGASTSNHSRVLEFRRYGSMYFLSQFWSETGTGRSLGTTPYEREIAAQLHRDISVQTASVTLDAK